MQKFIIQIIYFFINKFNKSKPEVFFPPILTKIEDNNMPIVKGKPSISKSCQEKLDTLHPFVKILAIKLIEQAFDRGILITITQGTRTLLEQANLYNKGRDSSGKVINSKLVVTNAKPGSSWHNFSYAFDIAFIVNNKIIWEGNWEQIGIIGENLGLEWGGRFTSILDLPHFQFRGPKGKQLTLVEAKAGKTLPLPPNAL